MSDREMNGDPAGAATAAPLRVCRAIFSYPTSLFPGAGLPAYYLSALLPHRTLHLARRTPGEPRPMPPHVTLRLIPCPNPPLSGKRSLGSRLWRVAAKLAGIGAFFAQAVPALLRYRPQLLHLHTHLPAPLAPLGRLLGARVVITVHGTDLLAVRESAFLRRLYRRAAHEIWYVSAAMHDSLREMFPGTPLVHTPSGVDLELFRPAGAERRQQLVTVGTLKWQKGYPVLLAAFAQLAPRFPGLDLVIVGDGEQREELARTVREAGLEERVRFLGSRSQEEIAATLGESELFVLASLSEGFPKVVLEALACGLPVVVTDVGSCGGVVREYGVGLVVPPGDADALAAAVARMLSEPALRDAAAAAARPAALQHGWERVAAIVEENYRRLLQETG